MQKPPTKKKIETGVFEGLSRRQVTEIARIYRSLRPDQLADAREDLKKLGLDVTTVEYHASVLPDAIDPEQGRKIIEDKKRKRAQEQEKRARKKGGAAADNSETESDEEVCDLVSDDEMEAATVRASTGIVARAEEEEEEEQGQEDDDF